MLDEYARHNRFWESLKRFREEDPHLAPLQKLPLVHPLDWWQAIDWQAPGILMLTGGRQIGKSTSTKLLIEHALKKKIFSPKAIFYLPCDQILDHVQLMRVLRFFLEGLPANAPFLLIVDEITFVKEWNRTIKALADEAWFRRGFCLVTGSDSVLLKEAIISFPGRRGEGDVVDFHLAPLSFRDYVQLVKPKVLDTPEQQTKALFQLFEHYLKCGGFLRAINDLYKTGSVSAATHATLEQWIRGDFLKRGKSTENLMAVLQTLVTVGSSQVSYSRLAQRTELISKETFIDYCRLLERMDLLFALQAFDQNKLRGFPKKDRKFHFADPFILATIEQWLARERLFQSKDDDGNRVEACVAAQFHKVAPVYYIKANGEIDLVVTYNRLFIPIEIKWSRQIRAKDLAQLKKYKNSVILTKQRDISEIDGIQGHPLPVFLVGHHSPETLAKLWRSHNKKERS